MRRKSVSRRSITGKPKSAMKKARASYIGNGEAEGISSSSSNSSDDEASVIMELNECSFGGELPFLNPQSPAVSDEVTPHSKGLA